MTESKHLTLHELTFDNVAKCHHEVTYDEVAGHFAGPMSKHPVISVKGHPEVIWVRPDMTVGSVANSISFGVGSQARQIPWREVKLSLARGYLPILTAAWENQSLELTQTSFATLLSAGSVKTGHEKQIALTEVVVRNLDSSKAGEESIWAFAPSVVPAKGVPPFPYNTYDLFEVVGELPAAEGELTGPKDNILRRGSLPFGMVSADSPVRVLSHGSAVQFSMDLAPGACATIRFIFTSSARGLTVDELAEVQKLDFATAYQRRVLELEGILEKGTRIQVPDEVVNHIYAAQILHNQSLILQAADESYCLPVQGYQGVWPWEAMKLTTHLDSIGYHDDSRKCLEYFLRVQGRFPPHGNFKSSDAVFGGTIGFELSGWENDPESTLYGQLAKANSGKGKEFPNWMNGTGAMLHAFATHYQHTRDRKWLEAVAPHLIRACDWIISERQETKKKDDKGEKVLHYGLLPIGRAYDTAEEAIRQLASDGDLKNGRMDDRHAPLDTYYPCFTDAYSSQGLSGIAEALADIGHAKSGRLRSEAQAYRDDILEVMRRTRTSDPSLSPYPERLNRPPAWAEFATGALSYLDTGFMSPSDAAFEQLEGYMKTKWNRGLLGLTGGMEKNGDPHGTNSCYVNFSEDIWHRGYLLRGEIEKALLAFYSMLAYGLDKQTRVTVERFHLSDTRYAPFFMDTSASARVCGLIRQALVMQDGQTLHLLAGVPRCWVETGKKIGVARAITTAGILNLHVASHLDEEKIEVDLEMVELRDRETTSVQLRLPHPARKKLNAVQLGGQPWTHFSPSRETISFEPRAGLTKIVATYGSE